MQKKNLWMKVCHTGAWRGNIQEEGLPGQEGRWQLVLQGAWPGAQSSSLVLEGMMSSTMIATIVESRIFFVENLVENK